MDSLQIPPEHSTPGPSSSSRGYQSSRPASVQPQMTSTPPVAQQSSRRQRASHTVVSSHQDNSQDSQPKYRDVYAHPAAQAWAAAHPGRAIPKFGPYLLLQTLGEGEFGKVKLGLHTNWGEEAAVKLIKRHNIDSAIRMSKVEREIEVLRMLKHPNIVRLYDVIETDKYIGIILDYASGGELFDHILAHRYLKEKDACKLFAQLISGVWYIHERKIVHRDLKLENLLLDRNRNVIITDFGFANRFEHRADDLMQTSCGSPCYAAPELVISEGAYVGSAVDIWSCGVILYAMLAGYLPFDDDPANPDGDNINLLYKYIVSTPLSFPDYISPEARDLLGIMLQPDPTRRASLSQVMQHPWLTPYQHLFEKSVDDLENIAMELHRQKRLQYQKQMRAAAQAAESASNKMSRSQSARNDVFPHASVSGASPNRSRSHRDREYAEQQQPEYLYETSAEQTFSSPPRAKNAVPTVVTTPGGGVDDDPFASTPTEREPKAELDTPKRTGSSSRKARGEREREAPGSVRAKADMRHTIQVEFVKPEDERPPTSSRDRTPAKQPTAAPTTTTPVGTPASSRPPAPVAKDPHQTPTKRRPSNSSASRVPVPAVEPTPIVMVNSASPPRTLHDVEREKSATPSANASSRSGSTSSRHRKGLSIDKIGFGKIFGAGEPVVRQPSDASTNGYSSSSRRPSTLQVAPSAAPPALTMPDSAISPSSPSPSPDAVIPEGRKSRRSTLSAIAHPLSTFKGRPKTATRDVRDAFKEPVGLSGTPMTAEPEKMASVPPAMQPIPPQSASVLSPGPEAPYAMSASTNKARKVMQWFRSRSKGGEGDESSILESDGTRTGTYRTNASSTSVNLSLAPPSTTSVNAHAQAPLRSASDASASFGERVMRHVAPKQPGVLRVHHGAVDQTTITALPPPEVMRRVRAVLDSFGIEVQEESEFKYRCIRGKKRRVREGSSTGLAAVHMVGSAASNGVDKRGLPVPSPPPPSSLVGSTGGMLKGLLMRRQSSQVSAHSPSLDEPSPDASDAGSDGFGTIYGDPSQDVGDEVRFYVELTRLDRLSDTYSLDVRRLKGNLRSYKFVYDTIRDRVNLR